VKKHSVVLKAKLLKIKRCKPWWISSQRRKFKTVRASKEESKSNKHVGHVLRIIELLFDTGF